VRTETDAKTTPSLPDLGILRRIALAMTAAFACIGAGASTAVPEQAKAIVQHGVGGLEVLKLESVFGSMRPPSIPSIGNAASARATTRPIRKDANGDPWR
jgi:hypothetical protein